MADGGGRALPNGVAARLLVAQLITAGTAFGINVLCARTLGPEGRGSLALFLQISYVLGVFCVAGVDRSYPASLGGRSRPGQREASGEILRLTVFPTAACAVLTTAVALVPPFGSADDLSHALALVLLLTGAVALTAIRTAAIAAIDASVLLIVTVAAQATLAGVAVLFTVSDVDDPLLWLTAYGFSALVPALILFAARPPRTGPDFSMRRRPARIAGLALLPSTLAGIVTLRADRLLLPLFAGPEALGLYVIVATMTETLAWPANAYVDAHVPVWAREHARGELRPARVAVASVGYVVVGTAVLGLAIAALVVPVFGEDYAPSVVLVWPLTVAAGLHTLSRVGVGIAIARSQPYRVGVVEVGSMVIALAAYLALIPAAGAVGAAWACVVGYGAGAVLATWAALTPKRADRPADALAGEG